MIGIIVNDVEMGGAGSAFAPSGHSYGYGYGGYGGYGGYRSYGKGYRPYAPYGPIETAKKTTDNASDAGDKGDKPKDGAAADEKHWPSHGAASSDLTDAE